jgi:large subunit ribosomal protein L19
MRNLIIDEFEKQYLRKDPLVFAIGDSVEVHCRIKEGEKERIQLFSGVVIARRGSGTREMFTVRRIVAGEGIERIFPVNTPLIAKLVVKRHGRVRRAKLYYLRDRIGKATKLVERRGATAADEAKAAAAEAKAAAAATAAAQDAAPATQA